MSITDGRRGVAAALAAFFMWGGLSIYIRSLQGVPAAEVLAHRILGGAVVALAGLAVTGGLAELTAVAGDRRRLAALVGSALSIAANWGLFIWGVTHGRALEVSMGYFIFPLIAVLLAWAVLGERMNHRRKAAVVVVALGVAWLSLRGQGVPWLALALAVSFGAYGLLRKTTPVSSLCGLAVETALLAPAALVYLALEGGGAAPHLALPTIGLLSLAGPVTAIPLWLFAFGARRLPLATLGLMMYVNPTVQMLVAVFLFGESFTMTLGIAFSAIWAGLALYSWPDRWSAV